MLFNFEEILRDQGRAALGTFVLYYLFAWPANLSHLPTTIYHRHDILFRMLGSIIRLGHFWPNVAAAVIWGILIGPIIYFWESKESLDKYPLPSILGVLFIPLYGFFLNVFCDPWPQYCVPFDQVL